MAIDYHRIRLVCDRCGFSKKMLHRNWRKHNLDGWTETNFNHKKKFLFCPTCSPKIENFLEEGVDIARINTK